MVIRLGLTGSVAMGKSTIAEMIRDEGVAVHDSDEVVRTLLARDDMVVGEVAKLFPHAVMPDGALARKIIASDIFANQRKRRQLEGILHPLVSADRDRWLSKMEHDGQRLVVFDIPLLYEIKNEIFCDKVAVVSAPMWTQQRRAMEREGMDEERFEAILAVQLSDAEKRGRADYVIPTGYGKRVARWYVRRILRELLMIGDKNAA